MKRKISVLLIFTIMITFLTSSVALAANLITAAKTGTIAGTLYDEFGTAIEGYEITLDSDDVTTTTNGLGTFSFFDSSFYSHKLTIKNSDGTVIEQYGLEFTYESTTGVKSTENTIYITYGSDSTSVSLYFKENSEQDGFTFLNGSLVDNPNTAEQTLWEAVVDLVTNFFS